MKKRNWFKSRTELIVFLISFFIALIFFLWQKQFFSWDFSVYMMNAEYALGYGNYFEWLRPPFVPFLLMIFRPLGRIFATYAFVIFCTCLYFFSLKLFHDKFLLKLKNLQHSEIFYLFAINPFVLFYGLYAGSELLSLSLIILFVVFAFSTSSFFFLGLSMLARYSNLLLFPLIFVSKNVKKILIGLGILILVALFWFLINYIFTGNALTSVMDYYVLNTIGREGSVFTSRIVRDLLFSTNIALPFFVLGFIFIFVKKSMRKLMKEKIFWLMIVFLVLTLLIYFIVLLKLERFLFNLVLPLAYFSVFGFNFLTDLFKENKKIEKGKDRKKEEKLKERKAKWFFFVIVFILILFSCLVFYFGEYQSNEVRAKEVKILIDKLNAENNSCMISSNGWVYFNYFGRAAYYPPRALMRVDSNETDFSVKINEGYNIIIFRTNEDGSIEENYFELKSLIENLDSELIFENNEKYIWIKNREQCKEPFIVNDSYIERTSKLSDWKWLENLL